MKPEDYIELAGRIAPTPEGLAGPEATEPSGDGWGPDNYLEWAGNQQYGKATMPHKAIVSRVIDGDTFEAIRPDGSRQTYRLSALDNKGWVDAPEVYSEERGQKQEKGGVWAAEGLRRELLGKEVYIAPKGPTADIRFDRYGRQLADVSTGRGGIQASEYIREEKFDPNISFGGALKHYWLSTSAQVGRNIGGLLNEAGIEGLSKVWKDAAEQTREAAGTAPIEPYEGGGLDTFAYHTKEILLHPSNLIGKTLESAPLMGSATAGTILGGPALGVMASAMSMSGNKYEDLIEKGVDPESAFIYANLDAGIEAGIEQVMISRLGKIFKGKHSFVTDRFMKGKGTQFAGRMASNYVAGTAEEVTQNMQSNIWVKLATGERLRLNEITEGNAEAAAAGGVLEMVLDSGPVALSAIGRDPKATEQFHREFKQQVEAKTREMAQDLVNQTREALLKQPETAERNSQLERLKEIERTISNEAAKQADEEYDVEQVNIFDAVPEVSEQEQVMAEEAAQAVTSVTELDVQEDRATREALAEPIDRKAAEEKRAEQETKKARGELRAKGVDTLFQGILVEAQEEAGSKGNIRQIYNQKIVDAARRLGIKLPREGTLEAQSAFAVQEMRALDRDLEMAPSEEIYEQDEAQPMGQPETVMQAEPLRAEEEGAAVDESEEEFGERLDIPELREEDEAFENMLGMGIFTVKEQKEVTPEDQKKVDFVLKQIAKVPGENMQRARANARILDDGRVKYGDTIYTVRDRQRGVSRAKDGQAKDLTTLTRLALAREIIDFGTREREAFDATQELDELTRQVETGEIEYTDEVGDRIVELTEKKRTRGTPTDQNVNNQDMLELLDRLEDATQPGEANIRIEDAEGADVLYQVLDKLITPKIKELEQKHGLYWDGTQESAREILSKSIELYENRMHVLKKEKVGGTKEDTRLEEEKEGKQAEYKDKSADQEAEDMRKGQSAFDLYEMWEEIDSWFSEQAALRNADLYEGVDFSKLSDRQRQNITNWKRDVQNIAKKQGFDQKSAEHFSHRLYRYIERQGRDPVTKKFGVENAYGEKGPSFEEYVTQQMEDFLNYQSISNWMSWAANNGLGQWVEASDRMYKAVQNPNSKSIRDGKKYIRKIDNSESRAFVEAVKAEAQAHGLPLWVFNPNNLNTAKFQRKSDGVLNIGKDSKIAKEAENEAKEVAADIIKGLKGLRKPFLDISDWNKQQNKSRAQAQKEAGRRKEKTKKALFGGVKQQKGPIVKQSLKQRLMDPKGFNLTEEEATAAEKKVDEYLDMFDWGAGTAAANSRKEAISSVIREAVREAREQVQGDKFSQEIMEGLKRQGLSAKDAQIAVKMGKLQARGHDISEIHKQRAENGETDLTEAVDVVTRWRKSGKLPSQIQQTVEKAKESRQKAENAKTPDSVTPFDYDGFSRQLDTLRRELGLAEGGLDAYVRLIDQTFGDMRLREFEIDRGVSEIAKQIAKRIGEKTYDAHGKNSDEITALFLAIDLKRHPSYVNFKLTGPEAKILARAEQINQSGEYADIHDQIRELTNKTAKMAYEAGVTQEQYEDWYVPHLWDFKTTNPGIRHKLFKQRSMHMKSRTLEGGIVEGWSKGYKLETGDILYDLQRSQKAMNAAIHNQQLISFGRDAQMFYDKGQTAPEHYVDVAIPATINTNGETGDVILRTHPEIAKSLKNAYSASLLESMPGMKIIDKINAVLKRALLLWSFFHAWAFGRSYALTQPGGFNIRRGMKEGRALIEMQDDIVRNGVKHGLTLGAHIDLKDSGPKNTLFYKKVGRNIAKYEKWLFEDLGASLKAKAYVNLVTRMTAKNMGKLTSGQLKMEDIYKSAGIRINNDFGGLDYQRLAATSTGKFKHAVWNPTTLHVMRLSTLGHDWNISNINSMGQLLNFKNQTTQEMHFDLWKNIVLRTVPLVLIGNLVMAGFDDDDYLDNLEKIWKDGDENWAEKFMLSLDVNISPLAHATGGDKKKEYYFSVIGHFKDLFKWTLRPLAGDPWLTPRSKKSRIADVAGSFATGSDFWDKRYSTIESFKKSKKKTFLGKLTDGDDERAGPTRPDEMLAYTVSQVFQSAPLPIQAMFGAMSQDWAAMGELAGLEVKGKRKR